MRESCTYGSVRGAPGNRRPYREQPRVGLRAVLTSLILAGTKNRKVSYSNMKLSWAGDPA